MNYKSKMELIYEDYLKSDDRMIEIDGMKFYKIITKDKLPVGDGMIVICNPHSFFTDSNSNTVIDENGNRFTLGSHAHYSFRETVIPSWYLETSTVEVKGICEKAAIGSYICNAPQ